MKTFALERLEARQLLAAASLVGGYLRIEGDPVADTIEITEQDATVTVSLNGQLQQFPRTPTPAPVFTEQNYLALWSDVQAYLTATAGQGGFQTGLEHYVIFGRTEQRNFLNAPFDEAFYLANNPDVAQAVANGFPGALFHYVTFGYAEGRSPSPGFVNDVKAIIVNGNGGNDRIINRTTLDAMLTGGDGDDYVRGGGAGDLLFGDAGFDVLDDFAAGGGSNLLAGGDGDDRVWGGTGPTDQIYSGLGNDTVYDIVGGPNRIKSGPGRDTIITRASDAVADFDPADITVRFGVAALPIQLVNGVLYFAGTTGNDVHTVRTLGNLLVASNGSQQQVFKADQVRFIAGIGGAGNDYFENATSVGSVYYGTGGNDVLIGGSGDDVLKGGGDNDVLFSGAGDDDLTGDAGADVIVSSPNSGRKVTRFDALDIVFAQDGLLVAL